MGDVVGRPAHRRERGKAPEKSISGAAGVGVHTACTADYSGDRADACRRPSDAREYPSTCDTSGNDRPTVQGL